MVNAWSLLYDEYYGTMNETFPVKNDNTITSLESDEYDPKPKSDKEDSDWKDPVITVGSGNTASTTFVKHFISNNNYSQSGNYSIQSFVAGYGNTTSAIDTIKFQMNTGNIDAGDICLYGIA